MMINIYSAKGVLRISTPINEGAKRKYTLMKEDYISFPFTTTEPIYFDIGDYAVVEGKRYEITDTVTISYNESNGAYEYDLTMEAYYMKWKNKLLKFTPETGGREASFHLTADLATHMGIFMKNLRALGYKFNNVDFTFSIDASVEKSSKLISYDKTNLIDALNKYAETWECEWWITDHIIHLGRCEIGTAVDFSIHRNVESMKRTEAQKATATRIYAFGSTRNIPPSYRPITEQPVVNGVVQRRLMLPQDTPYIDAIEGQNTEQAIEDIVVFDDVYPRRIGTVESISTKTYTDEVEQADGSIQKQLWNAYRITDKGLKFTKRYIIPGEELKIVFQSGKLNGMEFSVRFNPEELSEKRPEAQMFEIIRNEDYGRPLPDTVLCPSVGDKYILHGFDIRLISDVYIPQAEIELKEKAIQYVKKQSRDSSIYECTMMADAVLKADKNVRFYDIGQRVRLIHPAYFSDGRESRIIGYEYPLDIPYDHPIYIVGEKTIAGRIGQIETQIASLTYKGQVYEATAGSTVYLITSSDQTAPSDYNSFSAKRAQNEFISKQKDDVVKGNITFEEDITLNKGISVAGQARVKELISELLTSQSGSITNLTSVTHTTHTQESTSSTATNAEVREKTTTLNLLVRALAEIYRLDVKSTAKILQAVIKESLSSEVFRSGFAGEGFRIYKEAVTGDWNLEIDRVIVRKVFEVFEIRVQRLMHQGGMVISSPAGGEIAKVEDISTTEWRITLKDPNTFAVEDLVLCQSFKATQGGKIKRYWRRCTAVGGDAIRLSKTEAEVGSATPEAGDHIVTLGNINNPARQGAIIMASVGGGSPYIATYAGINTYSLVGKEVMREGNLAGIVDPAFGALSGYGLYAGRAYIKGELRTVAGKTIEQVAQEKADAIVVGGRNFLKGTSTAVDVSSPSSAYLQRTYIGVENLVIGETYTLSFDIQTFENKTAFVNLFFANGVGRSFPREYNSERTAGKKKIVITFKATGEDRNLTVYNGFGTFTAEQRQNNAFILSKLKLEKGNKATDWTPAPEETREELNAIRTDFQVREGEISAKVQQVTASVNTAKTYSDNAKNQADRATTQASTATTQAQNATTANTQAQQALTSVRSVESSITQKAGEITASVTSAKSYADRAEKTYNAIKVSENSIVVESAKRAVDGVKIGGRNLVKGSAGKAEVISPTSTYLVKTYQLSEPIKVGETYTLSYDVETFDGKPARVLTHSNTGFTVSTEQNAERKAGKKHYTKTLTNAHSEESVISIYNGFYGETPEQRKNNAFIVSNLKLEKGNKATDYTPAPEDYSTTEEIKSSLTMTPDKITLLGKQVSLTGQITFSAFNATTQQKLLSISDDVARKIGYSSAQDATTKTANGNTIISGGYLNTNLLRANTILSDHIASEAITADKIKTKSLTSAHIDASELWAKILKTEDIEANVVKCGENKSMPNGYNIFFDKYGRGDIGAFFVDRNEVGIRDENQNIRILYSRNKIEDFETIKARGSFVGTIADKTFDLPMTKGQYLGEGFTPIVQPNNNYMPYSTDGDLSTSATYERTHSYSAEGTKDFPNSFTVTKDGTEITMKIYGTYMRESGDLGAGFGQVAIVNASGEIEQEAVFPIYEFSIGLKAQVVTFRNLKIGNYTARISANIILSSKLKYAQPPLPTLHIYMKESGWKANVGEYRRIAYFPDGWYISYPNTLLYMSGKTGFVLSGKDVDIPGVICGARIDANRFAAYYYGKRALKQGWTMVQVDRDIAGIYRVYHSIGHNRYVPQVTPSRSGAVFVDMLEATDYYFEFKLYDKNGNPTSCAFNYCCIGENY